jgi:large subunit ribosomal protein L15
MVLQLQDLKPAKGSKKKRKRVGRGNASGHGTYSTRGLKGQKSRTGGKKGLRFKGIKNIIQNIPQKKGFKSIYTKKQILNLRDLNKRFEEGTKIDPSILLKRGLIANIKTGVKILGGGQVTKKLLVTGCDISRSARRAINKAGGSVVKKVNQELNKKNRSGLNTKKFDVDKKK